MSGSDTAVRNLIYRTGTRGAKSSVAFRLFPLILAIAPAFSAGMRAGIARANITPELPVWLNGYAARTHPSNHVMQDLWAKALALDDGHGGPIVIVTADVLFLLSAAF